MFNFAKYNDNVNLLMLQIEIDFLYFFLGTYLSFGIYFIVLNAFFNCRSVKLSMDLEIIHLIRSIMVFNMIAVRTSICIYDFDD